MENRMQREVVILILANLSVLSPVPFVPVGFVLIPWGVCFGATSIKHRGSLEKSGCDSQALPGLWGTAGALESYPWQSLLPCQPKSVSASPHKRAHPWTAPPGWLWWEPAAPNPPYPS